MSSVRHTLRLLATHIFLEDLIDSTTGTVHVHISYILYVFQALPRNRCTLNKWVTTKCFGIFESAILSYRRTGLFHQSVTRTLLSMVQGRRRRGGGTSWFVPPNFAQIKTLLFHYLFIFCSRNTHLSILSWLRSQILFINIF